MPRISQSSAALALAAVLSMTATPAAAVELPVGNPHSSLPEAGEAVPDDGSADRHRYRRYRRNRVDAGDVLAGVLIIGGIAAIASAATKEKRARDDYRYRDRDYRYRNGEYRPYRGDSRYDAASGIDNAVNMCVREIERDVRIDTVDSVDRTGEGWHIAGSLYNGDGFTCRIGNDGRIQAVDYGRRGVTYDGSSQDNQWDDDRYRAARADVGYAGPDGAAPGAEDYEYAQPAYPGGPIDGDYADD